MKKLLLLITALSATIYAPPAGKPVPINPDQQAFKQLRAKHGLETSDAVLKQILRVRVQGTPAQLHGVRASLNKLLSQDKLTAADLIDINAQIDALEKLSPAHWPLPDDYRALLYHITMQK